MCLGNDGISYLKPCFARTCITPKPSTLHTRHVLHMQRGGEVGDNLRTVVPVGVLCMFAFHGRRSRGFSLVVTGQK